MSERKAAKRECQHEDKAVVVAQHSNPRNKVLSSKQYQSSRRRAKVQFTGRVEQSLLKGARVLKPCNGFPLQLFVQHVEERVALPRLRESRVPAEVV